MPTTSTRPRPPCTAPEPPRDSAPPSSVRRRDGITLAATSAIPDRVRAQILAEHRAELDARTRAAVRARIDAGLYPLPIPYGYRRIGPDAPEASPTWTANRRGRAPAAQWRPEPYAATAVRLMSGWTRIGKTPTQIAAHLYTSRNHPPLLTLTGRTRPWTTIANPGTGGR